MDIKSKCIIWGLYFLCLLGCYSIIRFNMYGNNMLSTFHGLKDIVIITVFFYKHRFILHIMKFFYYLYKSYRKRRTINDTSLLVDMDTNNNYNNNNADNNLYPSTISNTPNNIDTFLINDNVNLEDIDIEDLSTNNNKNNTGCNFFT